LHCRGDPRGRPVAPNIFMKNIRVSIQKLTAYLVLSPLVLGEILLKHRVKNGFSFFLINAILFGNR
jgi:hypothetical protein